MDLSDNYLQALIVALMTSTALVAAANWLNRKHGGFMKGWAGAIFIAVGSVGAFAILLLKLTR
ncbi:MAG TPA: hypothetical protein VFB32_13085 [Rudaea sp.]|nr:hypothetical protein [Rudaea sp.]